MADWLRSNHCCSHLFTKPMRGLSKMIQAMVRRKTGMRIPTVSNTYMVFFSGTSVRMRIHTNGTVISRVTDTLATAKMIVFSRT